MSSPIRLLHPDLPCIAAATLAVVTWWTWVARQPVQPKPGTIVEAAAAGLAEAVDQSPPQRAGPSLKPASLDPPAPPGATSPALAAEAGTTVSSEHDILITWLEPGKSGGRLRFARLSEQAWSHPITVAEPVSTLDPTDRPSLTVIDTRSVRRTLIARTGDVVARSGDGGRTWTRLPAPVLPFASFAGGDEGGYVFWLATSEDGSSRLLGTRLLAGETLLDASVSIGSATSAAMTWDGPLVVYRDRSVSGAQDIAIVRRHEGRWTLPRPVHVETWHSLQQPHGGPRVAALRRQVAVAWFTQTTNSSRVLVAFSGDAGGTFGAPVEVDVMEKGAAWSGSADVALDDNGQALVLWMVPTGPRDATLHLARVSPAGTRGDKVVLATGSARRFTGIVHIARAGDRVAAAWSEGIPSRIRAAALPLASLNDRPSARSVRVVTQGS